MSMPTGLFDEQMAQLRELGYRAVSLEDVLAHYVEGAPLPTGAVLITFDDGYRDNLDNAAPVLAKHGYPAVQFVPIGYVGDPLPLPHEEPLAARGVLNRTVDWEQVRELERSGFRIESHGISHRPLADLELDEAAREIVISKLRLEEKLGRPVRAFSYVKGSEAHYKPVHLSLVRQAGYDLAFTSVSGANGPTSDPLELHRYNVEPYSRRTFELVLAGACDLIAVKDTVTGTHARRIFNAALGTSSK
jgi:peptidoglycan/xylan/chitin deacetylase (PgdA/CDA1 family)